MAVPNDGTGVHAGGGLAAVLAIDGGNSKTDAALFGRDGDVLASVRTSSTSHEQLGLERSIASLNQVVTALASKAGVDAKAHVARVGVFCLAGIDLPIDDRTVGRAIINREWVSEPVVLNDAFAVLRSGTAKGWGIAVVCGAGLNCVGVSPEGTQVRFPAMGLISGDWAAGGGWLGVMALGAAARGTDGRGPETLLSGLVPSHFGMQAPVQVLEGIRTGSVDHGQVVELVPVVFAAAAAGDQVAVGLLRHLEDEIAAMVSAAAKRLDISDHEVDVVLGGGVFRNEDTDGGFFQRVVASVKRVLPAARVMGLDAPPLVGAALIGFDRLGITPGKEAKVRSALMHEPVRSTKTVSDPLTAQGQTEEGSGGREGPWER